MAFGGGGTRGAAHVGVLKVLDLHGFKVKAAAGTSIGGLIGAIYLSGITPDKIVEGLQELSERKLFNRKNSDLPSLLGLEGVENFISEILGDLKFEDLAVPFAVTAVDLISGDDLIISEGRLDDAIMATIAVPGVFPAKKIGEMLLIDGGMTNPVPVDVVKKFIPNLPVVASVLSEPHHKNVSTTLDHRYFTPPPVFKPISRLRLAQAMNIFIRSLDIAGSFLTEYRLKTDTPDLVIRPKVYDRGVFDKMDITYLVSQGEAAAEEKLNELMDLNKWHKKLLKRIIK